MSSDAILLLFAVWWFLGSMAVMYAAEARGRSSGAWFWMGMFMGPILAVLCLLAYPEIEKNPDEIESSSPEPS